MVDKIECFGAEYFVSICATDVTTLWLPRKIQEDAWHPILDFSHLQSTAHLSPTTDDLKKIVTTTHINHDDWDQQWQLSCSNQPEIAITPASTYLVAIVRLIVAIASIIDPWSRSLSRIHLGHLNAAESTETRSLAARSLTFPCSDLLESHADGWFVVKKCAARLSDMWICEC